MFEDLREKKYNQIDSKSEREKREVDYISKIAEEYRSQIMGFLDDYDGISRDEKIFNKTREIISSLEQYCRPIGIMIHRGEINSRGAKLGWLNPSPLIKECDSYTFHLSEKGFEIVDGLKEIKGQLPLRESVKEVRERLFSLRKSIIPNI